MRRSWFLISVLAGLVAVPGSRGQNPGLIVRDTLGLGHLSILCPLLGCQIVENLGSPSGKLFLIAPTTSGSLDGLLEMLPIQRGIVSVEVNHVVNLIATPPLTFIPNGLADTFPVDYYGTVVWQGYLNQPASSIVRIAETPEPLPRVGVLYCRHHRYRRRHATSCSRPDSSAWI